MGVHTNYCVLARSFGIRQMVRLGRSVVLARDLTDALYDPRQPPYVSHARGTEMVVEHIERYWCPSILERRPDPRRAGLRRADRGDVGPAGEALISVPRPLEVRRAARPDCDGRLDRASSARLRPCRHKGRNSSRPTTPRANIRSRCATACGSSRPSIRRRTRRRRIRMLMIRTQSGVRPYGEDQYPSDPRPVAALRQGGLHLRLPGRSRPLDVGRDVRQHAAAQSRQEGPQDIDESSDTYDTIDWLLKNVANHNGKVGLYGTSYRGFLAAAGMIDAHPALKAVSPQAPIVRLVHRRRLAPQRRIVPGPRLLLHARSWASRGPQPVKEPLYRSFDYGTPDGYDFFLRLGPLAERRCPVFQGRSPVLERARSSTAPTTSSGRRAIFGRT